MAITPLCTRPAFSPNYDNKIFKKFSIRTLESKAVNKLAFQHEINWIAEKKIPLICIPCGMSAKQGGAMFESMLPGILGINCQIVIRGLGSQKYGSLFTKLAEEYPYKIKIIKDSDISRRKMYAACDIAIFFSEDRDELANCLAYGVIPVSVAQDGISDFDPVQENGNSFSTDTNDPWLLFAALIRACETFRLPYDWKTIQKQAMETVKVK